MDIPPAPRSPRLPANLARADTEPPLGVPGRWPTTPGSAPRRCSGTRPSATRRGAGSPPVAAPAPERSARSCRSRSLCAMNLPLAAAPGHLAASVATAGDGHSSLYECCVAVIIAVLVVLYFDERVRNAMTLPQRGRAIGWLGGILALGIFMPVHEKPQPVVSDSVISVSVRWSGPGVRRAEPGGHASCCAAKDFRTGQSRSLPGPGQRPRRSGVAGGQQRGHRVLAGCDVPLQRGPC